MMTRTRTNKTLGAFVCAAALLSVAHAASLKLQVGKLYRVKKAPETWSSDAAWLFAKCTSHSLRQKRVSAVKQLRNETYSVYGFCQVDEQGDHLIRSSNNPTWKKEMTFESKGQGSAADVFEEMHKQEEAAAPPAHAPEEEDKASVSADDAELLEGFHKVAAELLEQENPNFPIRDIMTKENACEAFRLIPYVNACTAFMCYLERNAIKFDLKDVVKANSDSGSWVGGRVFKEDDVYQCDEIVFDKIQFKMKRLCAHTTISSLKKDTSTADDPLMDKFDQVPAYRYQKPATKTINHSKLSKFIKVTSDAGHCAREYNSIIKRLEEKGNKDKLKEWKFEKSFDDIKSFKESSDGEDDYNERRRLLAGPVRPIHRLFREIQRAQNA